METETTPHSELQIQPAPRTGRPELETAAGLAATALVATGLLLTAVNAGPLWRDETNSINMAQMPSIRELWNNLPFESFPPLWLLLLRGWSWIGMAGSDAGIRVLGLLVGLLFLGLLWLCARWVSGRAPLLSLALLGSLPSFFFTVGSNRAFGLAMCLLILTFGTIWRLLEKFSGPRIVAAFLSSILFVHCVYYDVIFLGAMLFGAGLVVIRRRQWKTLVTFAGIGATTAGSLAIYLPIIRRGSGYAPMIQIPEFSFSAVWEKLSMAVTTRSSAQAAWPPGPEIWLWLSLVAAGTCVALWLQIRQRREASSLEATSAAPGTDQVRADLALFSCVSMLCGAAGYVGFLLRLRYPTNPWYYTGMLSLCAIFLEGTLCANLPRLRPWRLIAVGFLAAMVMRGLPSVWEEAHTKRSNVDLIAATLAKEAEEGDLILVQTVWEGVTFDRYYRGRARWLTLPPIASHKVHSLDLVWKEFTGSDPIAPVLRDITDTLQRDKRVWVVGNLPSVSPEALPRALPPPPHPKTKWWLGPYTWYWGARVRNHLLANAQEQASLLSPGTPVYLLEYLPLFQFSGIRASGGSPNPQVSATGL